MHQQTWVKVNAAVDAGIAPLVDALSQVVELRTEESCQGDAETSAHVSFVVGETWQDLARFVLGFLGPRLAKAVGDSAYVSIRVCSAGLASGLVVVRPGTLGAVTEAVASFCRSWACCGGIVDTSP